MLFRKRKRAGEPVQKGRSGRKKRQEIPGYITIEYDMLKKGADSVRHGRTVRQFGVMMHGTIQLVTSGDTVDRATYDALVAAGAVEPPKAGPEAGAPPERNTGENDNGAPDEEKE